MANIARGNHVSPGIYSKEIDHTYSVQSLGITSLALIGETLEGPAFEPIDVTDWSTFKNYFGGTSPEKFKGTQYPKYELPYIAKSYLTESKRLSICRILGLSGYNAGKAWLLCAKEEKENDAYNKHLVAVLRSRGNYMKYSQQMNETDDCGNPLYKYDDLVFDCDEITISKYTTLQSTINCGDIEKETNEEDFSINPNNLGVFTLNAYKKGELVGSYGVSLNPGSKNYIINVLGGRIEDGEAPIFVEELYDVSLTQGVDSGLFTSIYVGEKIENKDEYKLDCIDVKPIIPVSESVVDFLCIPEVQLTRKNVGQMYVCDADNFQVRKVENGNVTDEQELATIGTIYIVSEEKYNGKKVYIYKNTEKTINPDNGEPKYVFVKNKNRYVTMDAATNAVTIVNVDMNNYKERYRCAVTPWFVSELKGDAKNIDLKKLFRFYTITDGNTANAKVKISIENILPDDGLFDVIVRDYYDSDGNLTILERFTKCSMIPGTSNYIGYKIGTVDGEYELKSKYIMAEVIANEVTAGCVPAGFLGYPIRSYNGILPPALKYNTLYDEEIKSKKQYFGLSDITGVDLDILTYKGVNAYSAYAPLTNGFHLDSNISKEILNNIGNINITVDGESGYVFDCVSPLNVTETFNNPSLIGSEEEMATTIYKDVNLRKFTVYPYGGFDGWDIYRESRTNTDEYKSNKYQGSITNGMGNVFSVINDGEGLDLTGRCITSDYYAYLAGYRKYANKEGTEINLIATPGIDFVNNKLLVQDVIDIVEGEERRDCLYVMTCPDKPSGASDAVLDMYSEEEIVELLNDSDIDSSYVATYYPWVKYLDTENDCYINLPVTKDVLRNFAMTDNNAYPWYAAAGVKRGMVSCVSAHKTTKLAGEDTLYEGLINPVKTFATEGVKIWGNKTVYSKDTPLNRVNVRRLMIRIQKLINESVTGLIFDPNDNTVANQFQGIVSSILNDIKSNRGIYDYYVIVDTSAEARDRHELPATIGIKPTSALEYIDITYHVTPEGVSWD